MKFYMPLVINEVEYDAEVTTGYIRGSSFTDNSGSSEPSDPEVHYIKRIKMHNLVLDGEALQQAITEAESHFKHHYESIRRKNEREMH